MAPPPFSPAPWPAPAALGGMGMGSGIGSGNGIDGAMAGLPLLLVLGGAKNLAFKAAWW